MSTTPTSDTLPAVTFNPELYDRFADDDVTAVVQMVRAAEVALMEKLRKFYESPKAMAEGRFNDSVNPASIEVGHRRLMVLYSLEEKLWGRYVS